jgi:glycosyltransferase involved in cell wall biosynthesis
MTRILVVGQTPPPLHGQAIMIEKMLQGDYGNVELYHVRMAFSSDIGQVGKLRLQKLWELIRVIGKIWVGRLVHRARVLYYPPAGPAVIPVLRDIAILLTTRWAFEKTIFHFHAGGLADLYEGLSPFARFLFRLAYFKPDLAIRVSQHAPRDGEKLRALKECVIPNGIEDEAAIFRCAQEKSGRLAMSVERDPSAATILFVGVLRESKGVMILLEACRLLREKGILCRASLMGAFESAQFEQEVRDFVHGKGLTSSVTFLGTLTGDAKREAFSTADIFCLPTYYESETFGLVLVEALSFGLPVVATHWRGIPDVVEDGVCGFLVPVRDPPSVAEKLELLIQDQVLRRSMGEQGRKRYLEHFTIDKYHQRLKAAFEEVTGAHGD